MLVFLMLSVLSCTFLEGRESMYITFFVCGYMYVSHPPGLQGKIEKINVTMEETVKLLR